MDKSIDAIKEKVADLQKGIDKNRELQGLFDKHFHKPDPIDHTGYLDKMKGFGYDGFVKNAITENCNTAEIHVMKAGTVKYLATQLKILTTAMATDKIKDPFMGCLAKKDFIKAIGHAKTTDLKYIWIYGLFILKHGPSG